MHVDIIFYCNNSMYVAIFLCYNNHNMPILFLYINLITPDGCTACKLLSKLSIYYVCSCIITYVINEHKYTYAYRIPSLSSILLL